MSTSQIEATMYKVPDRKAEIIQAFYEDYQEGAREAANRYDAVGRQIDKQKVALNVPEGYGLNLKTMAFEPQTSGDVEPVETVAGETGDDKGQTVGDDTDETRTEV